MGQETLLWQLFWAKPIYKVNKSVCVCVCMRVYMYVCVCVYACGRVYMCIYLVMVNRKIQGS